MMANATEEVELKLELTADGADRLEYAAPFGREPRVIRQRATYFDTPDHRLAAAGFALRIRDDGARRVQTIKAGGAAAGMFVRAEWECEVADDTPILDDATPIPMLLGDSKSTVEPLFTVENERRLWDVDGVEIALDRGRVIAGEREAPFHEIELERKQADAGALFALARRIDAIAPVHPGAISKAERGYRLMGPAPTASRAEAVALNRDMMVPDAFRAIAGACLRQYRLNAPLILAHRDRMAVHQTRIAIRRLRSALAIFKPLLGEGGGASFNAELRWLAGELADARDLDVLIARQEQGAVRVELLTARGTAYDRACAALESDRARGLMLDLLEWLAVGAWTRAADNAELRLLPITVYAPRALDRFRRKVKKGGRDLETVDDETRHDVRKAAKKLRYAAEFFTSLYTEKQERRRYKRFLAALEDFQEKLGVLNDIATAPDLLQRLNLPADPAMLTSEADKATLLAAASETCDALMDSKRFWR